MKASVFLILSLLSLGFYGYSQSPESHPGATWIINNTFSDEFNSGQLDLSKWDNDVRDWGTWSWEPENVYLTDSVLTLQMQHQSHSRGGKDYHFTSGIYRNRETVTYGYFETRIKASAKGQGSCPAFWLFSVGQPTPTEEGGVKYSEIDVVEIFQVPNQLQRLEMNLHTRIIKDGVLTWIRPGQGYKELTHNTWVAPWDPRNDFHTYGVLSRLDSIFWYVDGVQRGAKKNYYWHLPMHPTISMGLRTPYERYINGVRTVMSYPDSIPEPGFPTEMYADYVRVWNTEAQLYADYEKYYHAEFAANYPLKFDCRYFAGNGETVISDSLSGFVCKLQEIQSDGTVVKEYEQVDASVVGTESGLTSFQFSLSGVPPSASLPTGNQYVLRPSFRSSINGGETVSLKEEFYPITLLNVAGINDFEARSKIKIINSKDEIAIRLTDVVGNTEIMVHDLAGRQVFRTETFSNNTSINKTHFAASGVYVVSVTSDKLRRVEKVVINHF